MTVFLEHPLNFYTQSEGLINFTPALALIYHVQSIW